MLVTDRGEYGFYAKLDEVEKQLKDGGEAGQFVRIHQRYLVNTKWVRSDRKRFGTDRRGRTADQPRL